MTPLRIAVPEIATNLSWSPAGYWTSGSHSEVSYPDQRSDELFDVEEDSFWFRHRNRVIRALLELCAPPGVLLDIGGGNGFVALGLERAGHPTILLEPLIAGARNAVQRGLPHVICSDPEAAGFRPGSLPAVGLFDVLEHVGPDAAFLSSLRRWMLPGGRLYVTVPAWPHLWSQEDEHAGHQRRYTDRSLREVMAGAGFRVEYSSYFFSLLPLPIYAFRALPARLGLQPRHSVERLRREHLQESRISARILARLHGIEAAALRRGIRLPFGSSLALIGGV